MPTEPDKLPTEDESMTVRHTPVVAPDPAPQSVLPSGTAFWTGAHPNALNFDRTADRYERTRPEYPAEAIDCLIANLGIAQDSKVLDLAAGTGKLSRQLVSTGATVIAAEPLAGMRSQLCRKVPGALLVGSTAEAIPLRTGSASVVTVAQAFHWFKQDVAQPEICRVLQPGGGLGIIGYRFDRSVPWMLRLTALSNRYRKSYRKRIRSLFEEALASVIGVVPKAASLLSRLPSSSSTPTLSPLLFDPVQERRFYQQQLVDLPTLLERVGLAPKLGQLPPPERERLARDVKRCVDGLPTQLIVPYEVRFFWSHKR